MKHYKGLDSIRAMAVILVLFWHLMPRTLLINSFDTGPFGVDIFFVLSGFLITKILLENRRAAEISKVTISHVLKNFYVRRVLRIFPIYYLTIALIFLYQIFINSDIEFDLLSCLTYTTNFHFFKTHSWGTFTGHFWSLAVEEQFYILWPVLILLFKKKYLIYLIVAFILVGIISQVILGKSEFSLILPHACFDAFGLGALLAWAMVYQPQLLNNKNFNALSIVAFASAVFILAESIYKGVFELVPLRTFHSFIALWMITSVVFIERKGKSLSSLIYHNKILIFIGKMSYGIYIYHVFFMYYWKFFGRVNKHLPLTTDFYNPYLLFTEYFCIIILLSWLSFKLIEQPFLNLKKYFSYSKKIVTI
ncbi:MAG: acyltransferase [Ginsengibacter sp.]